MFRRSAVLPFELSRCFSCYVTRGSHASGDHFFSSGIVFRRACFHSIYVSGISLVGAASVGAPSAHQYTNSTVFHYSRAIQQPRVWLKTVTSVLNTNSTVQPSRFQAASFGAPAFSIRELFSFGGRTPFQQPRVWLKTVTSRVPRFSFGCRTPIQQPRVWLKTVTYVLRDPV